MFHFSDLKKEKQIDFISKNLSEILFKQRHELNLSQEQFLKKFFNYNIYTKKSGYLSLSQLKRYEKEYKKQVPFTVPKKNSKIFDIILNFSVVDTIYIEKIFQYYLKEYSLRFAKQLEELGLLDCLEKATSGLVAMNYYNSLTGKNYDKYFLLDWLFNNARQGLSGEQIPELIYDGIKTRHDIKRETKN